MKKVKNSKKSVVVLSGGMDSALCLAYAIKKWGAKQVSALSFDYGQRHAVEVTIASSICQDWGVNHKVLSLELLKEVTSNALIDSSIAIAHDEKEQAPNTLVIGRNGLMAQIASTYAYSIGAQTILMGVIEVEGSNSGYRDCHRTYIDQIEQLIQIDLNNKNFKIETPIVKMNKKESYYLGEKLGVLSYLLEKTITCYNGLPKEGCQTCPSCQLRNHAILDYAKENPQFKISYLEKIIS